MSPEDEKFLAETKTATARNASCLERLVAVKLCRIVDGLSAEIARLTTMIEARDARINGAHQSIASALTKNAIPIPENLIHDGPAVLGDRLSEALTERDKSHQAHEACKALIRDFQTENDRLRAKLFRAEGLAKP